jgi:uncharacterized protein
LHFFAGVLVALWLVTSAAMGFADTLDDALPAKKSGDFQTAGQLFSTTAKKGSTAAQYNLGVMCANGQGVAHDYREAVKWYRLAAEQGHAGAQFNLGGLYCRGQGVSPSDAEAYAWWTVAAASGNEPARKPRAFAQKAFAPSQISKGQKIAREIQGRLSSP